MDGVAVGAAVVSLLAAGAAGWQAWEARGARNDARADAAAAKADAERANTAREDAAEHLDRAAKAHERIVELQEQEAAAREAERASRPAWHVMGPAGSRGDQWVATNMLGERVLNVRVESPGGLVRLPGSPIAEVPPGGAVTLHQITTLRGSGNEATLVCDREDGTEHRTPLRLP